MVELERGPIGLGMGLIDGVVSSHTATVGCGFTAQEKPAEKLMASHGSWAPSAEDKEAQRDLSVDLYSKVTVLCVQSPQLSCSWEEQTGSALLWKENDSAEVFPPPFSGGRSGREGQGGSQGVKTAPPLHKKESGIVGG